MNFSMVDCCSYLIGSMVHLLIMQEFEQVVCRCQTQTFEQIECRDLYKQVMIKDAFLNRQTGVITHDFLFYGHLRFPLVCSKSFS
jgi:hypothetical protein